MFLAVLQKKSRFGYSESCTLSVTKLDIVKRFFLMVCALFSSFLMSISFSIIPYMCEEHYSKILILSLLHSSFKITN